MRHSAGTRPALSRATGTASTPLAIALAPPFPPPDHRAPRVPRWTEVGIREQVKDSAYQWAY
jgi:hypothetical protein